MAKNLNLQTKFTLVVGAGVLALAVVTVAVVGYFEFSSLETRLRTSSENELNSLNSLVESAMKMRIEDPQNVAIRVFNGWFEARNKEYAGKLWSVWGAKTAAYMARTAPEHAPKVALDATDEEALRTGRPVGRFVNDTYRYSMPIVMGSALVTKQEICIACHEGGMATKNGEVINVFSNSLSTIEDFAMLRQRILFMSGGALVAILAMIFAVWSIFGRVVAGPLRALILPLEDIAGGNFAVEVPGLGRKDEVGQIAAAVGTMADQIRTTITEIKASGREVTNASAEISTSTTDLSQRTEEQAASLEQTSAAMEELSATVKKNAENAQQANLSASGTREVADRGGQVVAKAVEAMAKIEDSSRKISDIIGVIDEIARQTNLLALNAAVEAARAGEAGRGFAVVASEVRSLAQRSSQAAKDIKDLITNSNGQVKDGVDLVNRAGAALTEIVESIKKVAEIVADIASASSEQATGIEQINKALNQMDEVTQQNSALVEENAATAKTLEHQSKAMDEQVAFFQIGDVAEGGYAAQPAETRELRPVAAMPSRVRAAAPRQQPVAAPKRAAAGGNSGGPARRMQAALATAVNNDRDWKEF